MLPEVESLRVQSFVASLPSRKEPPDISLISDGYLESHIEKLRWWELVFTMQVEILRVPSQTYIHTDLDLHFPCTPR